MSFNVMDLIQDQLSDQVMGYLGSVIGGDSSQNSSAISSAIPAILSGLTNIGSSQSGAGALFDAFNKQDDGILDNLGGLLSNSKQSSSMVDAGSNILGSLMGNGGLGSLVGAISGFSGAGKSGTKSLLGLLAPIIFSVVKRKLLGGGGFNIGSLMGLLNGQKDNVSTAMPGGFAKQLESSGFSNISSRFSDTVAETSREVSNEGKSLLGRLLPLALLIGAAIVAYNLFFKGGNKSPEPVSDNVTTQQVDVSSLGKNVSGSLDSVISSLGSITDVNSAKAVLPSLASATSSLGNYAGMLDKLPAEARGQITGLVSGGIPKLQDIVNKVSAIPGVGAIIKPAVESLVSKLTLFK